MTAEYPKAEVVRYWWTKAEESLRAARRELGAGDCALAVNRAYYALFYARKRPALRRGTHIQEA